MRRAVLLSVAILCGTVAFAQTGTPTAQQDASSAAVVQVADNYVKAMLAGDAKAVAALYAEDAIEMPPELPMIKGRAAIEQYYQKLLTGQSKLNNFSLSHLETRTSGALAYDAGTYQESLTPPAGQMVNLTGKYIVIAKQTAGSWKITYAIYNADAPTKPQQ